VNPTRTRFRDLSTFSESRPWASEFDAMALRALGRILSSDADFRFRRRTSVEVVLSGLNRIQLGIVNADVIAYNHADIISAEDRNFES